MNAQPSLSEAQALAVTDAFPDVFAWARLLDPPIRD